MEPSQVSGHNERLQVHGPLSGKDGHGQIANVLPRARLQPVEHLDMPNKRCSLWGAFRSEVHEGHGVEEDEPLLVEKRRGFGVDIFAACEKVGNEGLDLVIGLGSGAVVVTVAEINRASVAEAARANGVPDGLLSCAASHCVSVSPLGGDEVKGWTTLVV